MLHSRIAQLAPDLAGCTVSAQTPDQASANCGGLLLNLFLFDVPVDKAFRQREAPGQQEHPGSELCVRPRYLMTAYGLDPRADGGAPCHRLMGAAMAAMHDPAVLPGTGTAALRIERVELTIADMTALWSRFGTPYRLSAVYEIGPLTLSAGSTCLHE